MSIISAMWKYHSILLVFSPQLHIYWYLVCGLISDNMAVFTPWQLVSVRNISQQPKAARCYSLSAWKNGKISINMSGQKWEEEEKMASVEASSPFLCTRCKPPACECFAHWAARSQTDGWDPCAAPRKAVCGPHHLRSQGICATGMRVKTVAK